MMHAADHARHGWPDPGTGLRVLSVPTDGGDATRPHPRPIAAPTPIEAHRRVEGIDAAVVEVYQREYAGIARLAFLLVGDRHRAEDLAHDAFVRLYEHWDDVDPDKAVAWLRRTTSNLAMSAHRRARTARQHRGALGREHDDGPARSAEAIAIARSARPDVVRALQQLSPKQRAAVVLKHWLRMTESEIAEALDCSLGTTRTHIARGHRTLARQLGGHR